MTGGRNSPSVDATRRELLRARAAAAGVEIEPVLDALSTYLDLLALWNRRMNLTALPIDSPSPAAIDRLIIEPLRAAPFIRPDDVDAIDIGSGGGSPAVPLKIAVPHLRMRLIEARARKCAFLREAVRTLAFRDVTVETRRFGESEGASVADVITMRAVRLDHSLASSIRTTLRPTGRLLWFTTDAAGTVPGFDVGSPIAGLVVWTRPKLVK